MDIRSFILSYVSATLLKTSATRWVFSASVTVLKPKWVGRSDVALVLVPVLVLELFGAASRAALLVEKGRDVDIMAAEHLGAAAAAAVEGRRTADRKHDCTADLIMGPGKED
jgi:hypothetical protein